MTAPAASSFDPNRHRRGGRPRKAASDRRDGVLSLRLPLAILTVLAARATAAGLSLADYARAALDGTPVQVTVSQTAAPEVIQQLRMIGVNLRQAVVEVKRGCFADPALEASVAAALLAASQTVSAELRFAIHGSES